MVWQGHCLLIKLHQHQLIFYEVIFYNNIVTYMYVCSQYSRRHWLYLSKYIQNLMYILQSRITKQNKTLRHYENILPFIILYNIVQQQQQQ